MTWHDSGQHSCHDKCVPKLKFGNEVKNHGCKIIWINGQQKEFWDEALYNIVEHVELGLECREVDWWNQCFAAEYWSEWTIVLQVHSLRLKCSLSSRADQVSECLKDIYLMSKWDAAKVLNLTISNLDMLIDLPEEGPVSIWSIQATGFSEAQRQFESSPENRLFDALMKLPHLQKFISEMEFEKRVLQKAARNAEASMNACKKAVKRAPSFPN